MRPLAAILLTLAAHVCAAQQVEPVAAITVGCPPGRTCHVIFPATIAYVCPSDGGIEVETVGDDGRMLRIGNRCDGDASVTVATTDSRVYPIRIVSASMADGGVYRISPEGGVPPSAEQVRSTLGRICSGPIRTLRSSAVRQGGICLTEEGVFLHRGVYLLRLGIRNTTSLPVDITSVRILSVPRGRLRQTAYGEEELRLVASCGEGARVDGESETSVGVAVDPADVGSGRRYTAEIGIGKMEGCIRREISFHPITILE